MAHECPECYQLCHCGGDIDDCLLNSDRYVNGCDHCWGKDDEPVDYSGFDDEDFGVTSPPSTAPAPADHAAPQPQDGAGEKQP